MDMTNQKLAIMNRQLGKSNLALEALRHEMEQVLLTEQVLFNAFNATDKLAKEIPIMYQAKPLTREDLEELKRKWIEEMNKPQYVEVLYDVQPVKLKPLVMPKLDPPTSLRRHELVGISVLKPYEPKVIIKHL